MRLADYFVGALPNEEEMDTFRPEEYDQVADTLLEKLEAFLSDAEDNPEADPAEVEEAKEILAGFRRVRQTHFAAKEAEVRARQALAEADENVRREFAKLSDKQLRALTQFIRTQNGPHSPEYQQFLNALRQFAPHRLALALDT